VNRDRVLVLARKDLDEIRTSRYLLGTLIGFPFLFAVLTPVITLVAVGSIPAAVPPWDLHPAVTQVYANQTIQQVALTNASIQHSEVTTGVISGSRIGNSTLDGVVVVGSVLWNVTLRNSSVIRSNLYLSSLDSGTVVTQSAIVGQPSAREQALGTLTGLFEFYLVLTPLVVPSALAAYTIVGEKTSRSLEPLLATPLSDRELIAGKALAIFAATMAASWGSFLVFQLIISYSLPALIGLPFTTGATWYILMFLVAPMACLLGIAVNLVVSTRVNDVRAGQQLSSLVLLPVLLVVIGFGLGFIGSGWAATLALGAALAGAAVLLFLAAARLFAREEILARWK